MAQLNIYTYLSQATWLIIIYIVYYVYLKQSILTRILEKRRIIINYNNLLKSTKTPIPNPNGMVGFGTPILSGSYKYFHHKR